MKIKSWLNEEKVLEIYLTGNIVNSDLIDLKLSIMDKLPDTKSIKISISSDGGNGDTSLAIYAFLRYLNLPITTINMGNVSSGACIIFAAGDKRLCVPYAYFYFHSAGIDLPEGTYQRQYLKMELDRIIEWENSAKRIMFSVFGDKFEDEYESLFADLGKEIDCIDAGIYGITNEKYEQ